MFGLKRVVLRTILLVSRGDALLEDGRQRRVSGGRARSRFLIDSDDWTRGSIYGHRHRYPRTGVTYAGGSAKRASIEFDELASLEG